jgi:hypothetical protein
MKPAKLIFAVILIDALLLNLPASAVAAGSGKNSSSERGGKAAEHMSDKGRFNSNAQWSADPDKGWVRADERHKMHEKNGSPGDVNQHNGRSKGKGKAK